MSARVDWRAWLAFAHDVCAAVLAWVGLYWLRFGLEFPQRFAPDLVNSLALVVPLQAAIFHAFGLYRGLWRFASLVDMKRILMAVGLGSVLIPLLLMLLQLKVVVPRTVLILYPIVLVALMAGSRFAYRLWKEHRLYSPLAALGEPVLVLGAGEAGALLTKELERSRQWRVVGLLDDDPAKRGRMLRNIQVLGPIEEVGAWARRFGVHQVIIALPSADHTVRRRAAERCAQAGVVALTVPSYEDLISGRAPLSTVRQVELDDLLGRDPVRLDNDGLREWLGGRVVLVTGAGGSIGNELCRQIARFRPERLVLFDASEYSLYTVTQALADEYPGLATVSYIGDVKSVARVAEVVAANRPSIVFHAAAYKHVPLMEEQNAWEAVRNNAWGTYVIARAAVEFGVEKFVLVSTDKAINPTSVMGASKRLAEMICQRLQNGRSEFALVRFGNVVGSTGSVIPRFREQIARGGPVTVTHPEVTRYFMSVSEAAQLVLQAGWMGKGGEILVLDMGEPVRIADLARDLIRLSGVDPARISVTFTGLRPGEKLFEEPIASEEATLPTPHPKLRIARARPVEPAVVDAILDWLSEDRPHADAELRARLRDWIPEYSPPGTDLEPPLAGIGHAPVTASGSGAVDSEATRPQAVAADPRADSDDSPIPAFAAPAETASQRAGAGASRPESGARGEPSAAPLRVPARPAIGIESQPAVLRRSTPPGKP